MLQRKFHLSVISILCSSRWTAECAGRKKRDMQSRSECRSGGDCWCQTLWVNESEEEEQETEQSCLLNGGFFLLSWRVKYCGKWRGGWEFVVGGAKGQIAWIHVEPRSADRVEMIPLGNSGDAGLPRLNVLPCKCLQVCGGAGLKDTAGVCVCVRAYACVCF